MSQLSQVDISGLDPTDVLMALYKARMGFFAKPNIREEAFKAAFNGKHVDYFYGIAIKTSITPGVVDFRLYDRDYGAGAAAKAIATLKK